MPSRICCPDGHLAKWISAWEAAVAVSENQPIGACKKCGQDLEYQVSNVFASDPRQKQYAFTVKRAVRLETRMASEASYDPFLLVLREIETGKEQILPTLWTHGQNNAKRESQFPLLLKLDEWKALFRILDASFLEMEERIRVRAYELYEQRGNRDGHALDDWLQAKRELSQQKSLSAAA